MGEKLNQRMIDALTLPGPTLHDSEVPGLRVVRNKKSASYVLQTDQWSNRSKVRCIRVTLARTNEVTLKRARELAIEKKLAIRRGENPNWRPPRGITLGEAWATYLRTRGPELSQATIDWCEKKVNGALKRYLNRPLSEIDRAEARRLHESLTESAGPWAANGALRVLKMLYNDAARVEDLPPNPVTRAVRMNKERPRNWALGQDELRQFWQRLEALESSRKADLWLLMLLTGLRSLSARSACWEHLSDDGCLFIPTPKGGPDRAFTIPLSRFLLQRLEQRRQEDAPLESRWVFPSETSKRGFYSDTHRTANFPYPPHMMRHTYRNLAIEAGVSFENVTLLMNHRLPHVSFRYITRDKLMSTLRQAQEQITEHVLRIVRPPNLPLQHNGMGQMVI